MRGSKVVRALAVFATLALVAACGDGPGSIRDDSGSARSSGAATPSSRASSLVELVKQTGASYDYEAASAPAALLQNIPVAVEGVVTSVIDGPIEFASDVRASSVVVTLEVEDVFKGAVETGASFAFYLARPSDYSVVDYQAVIPHGTRFVVLGYETELGGPVENEFAGRNAGEPLYSPDPQGLFAIAGDPVRAGPGQEATATSVPESIENMPAAWQSIDSAQELRDALS